VKHAHVDLAEAQRDQSQSFIHQGLGSHLEKHVQDLLAMPSYFKVAILYSSRLRFSHIICIGDSQTDVEMGSQSFIHQGLGSHIYSK